MPLKLVLVLPKPSLAVTVTAKVEPAVAAPGALTTSAVTEAGLTLMLPISAVMAPAETSAAVNVCGPAVSRVTLKKPTPLVNELSVGSAARPALLLKWTVPP
jgi:hypothetical protein